MPARAGLLAGSLLVAALLLPGMAAADLADRGSFCLTVLHNNDAESQLLDAGSGELENFGGAAEFVTVVKRQRRAALRQGCEAIEGLAAGDGHRHRFGRRGVITVSSGDNFLAGPAFTASLETRDPPQTPFFDSIVVSAARYDALALGNHEFDFGPDVLADFIQGVSRKIPFVSANLDFTAEAGLQELVDQGRIARSIVTRRSGKRIGIVGATTEDLRSISSPGNVVIEAVRPAVQAEIDALTAEGVKMIVLISHLQSVNEDLALLPLLHGVDIAIAGGGDEVLANEGDLLVPGDVPVGPYPLLATNADGHEVPVVTTAGNYKYLGRLACLFDADGVVEQCAGGPVRVARIPAQGEAPEDAVPPDPLVARLVTGPVAAFVADLDTEVIGTSEVALNGVRTDIRTIETNLGDLVADALLAAAGEAAAAQNPLLVPDVALQNGGGIRNDDVRGPGDISDLDTFDILPFANFLAIVPAVPREQFKAILESAVSAVEDVGGRFAQIAGFRFSWDARGTPQEVDDSGNVLVPGSRVVEVTLDDGTQIVSAGVVVPGEPVDVATIGFLARGGDQYPFAGAAFTNLGISDQQALSQFIQANLGGVITAADYPQGGEGRIVRLP
jgi:5'-nucleotidase